MPTLEGSRFRLFDAIASLVERLYGSRVSEERIAAIAARSDGNPFFVRELALEALESRGEAAFVPPLLGSVLRGRLHRLPSPAREVLEAAAVAGGGGVAAVWLA